MEKGKKEEWKKWKNHILQWVQEDELEGIGVEQELKKFLEGKREMEQGRIGFLSMEEEFFVSGDMEKKGLDWGKRESNFFSQNKEMSQVVEETTEKGYWEKTDGFSDTVFEEILGGTKEKPTEQGRKQGKKDVVSLSGWFQDSIDQQDFSMEAGMEIFPVMAETILLGNKKKSENGKTENSNGFLLQTAGQQKSLGWQAEKTAKPENLKPMLTEIKEILSDLASRQGEGEKEIDVETGKPPTFSISRMMEEMKQRLWEERELCGKKG